MPISRWAATRLMGRLGLIAGTLSGVALAFHLGGRDGYTLPMSFLLGYPTNLLVHVIPHFALSSAGPASEWSLSHLAWCAAIAVNWTLVGAAMDLVRRHSDPPPSQLGREQDGLSRINASEPDSLMASFDALERAVKIREKDRESPKQRAA
ncbi:MAG: hypothetical protein ABJE47_22910 [bacterium]